MGSDVGANSSAVEGITDGATEIVGEFVEGLDVGKPVGLVVGRNVGLPLGNDEGDSVGNGIGARVGRAIGALDGFRVGWVGACVDPGTLGVPAASAVKVLNNRAKRSILFQDFNEYRN